MFTTVCYATMHATLLATISAIRIRCRAGLRGLLRGARVAFISRLCGIHFPLIIVSATRERKRVIIPTLKCTTIYYVRIDI